MTPHACLCWSRCVSLPPGGIALQGISDGASAVVLASEQAVKAHSLTPLARVAGYSVTGVDPAIMGIGPAPAIRKLLESSGLHLADIDLVEVGLCYSSGGRGGRSVLLQWWAGR